MRKIRRPGVDAPARDGDSPAGRLHPLLRHRIAERLGWSELRPVQKLAIAPILDGANTLILAPTAGGKTEAAFFPILSLLQSKALTPVSVLYLSPLKALLNNQEPRLRRLADLVDRTAFRWHGDVAAGAKQGFRRDPADILLITPESLEGLFLSRPEALFRNLVAIVVDEIHAFAGTDRGSHLVALIERVAAATARDVQRIGLSATVGNPEALLAWLSGRSGRPRAVVDPPRDGIKRYFTLRRVPGGDLGAVASTAAGYLRGRKAMFFVDARKTAEGLRPRLGTAGIEARVHHASVDRHLREAAEAAVGREGPACLICTSTMELGVDVGDLDAVLQLGAPATVASYLQRMGRSGRRGHPGRMVVLAGERESFLRAVVLTELARARWVEPVRLPDRDWAVCVQQILVGLLARGDASPGELYASLARCAAFAGIGRPEFERLVDHLCAAGQLERTGADRVSGAAVRLRLGFAAEREFGARNFAALRSVFEGGAAQMTVYAGAEAVGTVDRGFAAGLAAGKEFTLAGRNWRPARIDWTAARIDVAPGEAGGLPGWRGGAHTPMAGEVALAVRELLESDEHPAYLDPPERAYLDELRADARERGLGPGVLPIRASSARSDGRAKRLTLWTMAGERANRAIGLACAVALGTESHADWEDVTLIAPGRGSKLAMADLEALLDRWRAAGIGPGERRAAAARLPLTGASRFVRLLPPDLAAEVRSGELLDFDAAESFVRTHCP